MILKQNQTTKCTMSHKQISIKLCNGYKIVCFWGQGRFMKSWMFFKNDCFLSKCVFQYPSTSSRNAFEYFYVEQSRYFLL